MSKLLNRFGKFYSLKLSTRGERDQKRPNLQTHNVNDLENSLNLNHFLINWIRTVIRILSLFQTKWVIWLEKRGKKMFIFNGERCCLISWLSCGHKVLLLLYYSCSIVYRKASNPFLTTIGVLVAQRWMTVHCTMPERWL